jgi:Flp pilus assembly protein CpaB
MQQILASRLMSSRRGAALLGLAAAVLAGVVLLVYLNSYRKSVRSSTEPVTVLVARNLIEKGTFGSVIASKKLFQANQIDKNNVKLGAISDPALMIDRVAQTDIYPGQQITAADFSATPTDRLPVKLTGDYRGVSLSLDESHGIIGPLSTGDHVDVWRAVPKSHTRPELVLPDVEVLSAPVNPVGGGGANVVLQIKWWEAPRIIEAAEGGKIWLTLRPLSDAKPTKPESALYDITKGG